jgi:predicted ferric reductase
MSLYQAGDGSAQSERMVILKKKFYANLWLFVFMIMIFIPLILLAIFPRPPGREFLRDFSVSLGFLTMSLLGLQTIPTSRLKFITRYFAMEKLYSVHHKLSILTFILAIVHPVLLFINNPETLRLLNFATAPWRARAAVLSLLTMFVLIITSVWREAIFMKYDVWRWVHDVMAFAAVGLGLFHMFRVNYYMSLTYQRVLWLVLTAIWVAVILYIRIARPIIMIKKPYVVDHVKEELGQCWSLYVRPDGHRGFKYQAGQFAWITVESPFIFRENPFSFSSSANREDDLIGFTIKELGDFTSTIKHLNPGDRVYVDGPYGTFNLDEHYESRLVLIAGGIGSAPVLSILRTMRDRGRKDPVMFFYGNPTWDTVIFRDELAELEKEMDCLQVVHVLERPPEGWEGEKGFITAEILARHLPEDYKQWEYIFFLCGPMPMIQAVEGALFRLDVQQTKIFSEKYEMA